MLPDAVLVYVRAVKRGAPSARADIRDRARRPDRRSGEAAAEITYPVDAIFPVELAAG